MQKSHPKVVNPRDIAGERKKKKKKKITGMTQPGKNTTGKAGMEPRSAALETDTLPLGQRGVAQEREVCLPLVFVLTRFNPLALPPAWPHKFAIALYCSHQPLQAITCMLLFHICACLCIR